MIRFSIIIPAYNAEPYIYELLDRLNPQITDEVEVILIDDGSDVPIKTEYDWVKLYRQKNKGISKTRNRGLKLAKGEAIGFIDADDLVAENYVHSVLKTLKNKEWDYIDLSWRSLEDNHFWFKLNSDNDALENPSACTRIFKRSFIGDHRFPEKKDAAEDEHFTRHLELKKAKHVCITDFMYFYRTETPNSNSKQFMKDVTKTKRIAYYYNHVTANMTDLLERVKKDDESNEVFVLTNKCDIPELEKYCHLFCPPRHVRVMEKHGQPTDLIELVERPIKCDIVIWTHETFPIGGLETFIHNFCANMCHLYDIVVLYDIMDRGQIERVSRFARCIQNNLKVPVFCDSVIINRIFDEIPPNVKYNKSIQMVHCTKQHYTWKIPQNRDAIVCVSSASKESFKEEAKHAEVINNMTYETKVKDMLFIVSATRIGAGDKGKNDERMVKLANLMTAKGISYIWLYFGDKKLINEPKDMVYMGVNLDIAPYIKKADYLCQLSDQEAFSYSLLESLNMNTPLLVTPLEQNKDMHIVDGKNAYIIPFDFDNTFDVEKFLNIPKFEYHYDNKKLIAKWKKLIEETESKHNDPNNVLVSCTTTYQDLELKRLVEFGEIISVSPERAKTLTDLNLCKYVE